MYKAGLKNNKSAFHAGYVQALRDTLDTLHDHAEPETRRLSESLARRLEALRDDDEIEEPDRHPTESPRRPHSARYRSFQGARASSATPNSRASASRSDGDTLVATATATPNPGLRSLKTTNGAGAGSGRPPYDAGRGRRSQTNDSSIESESESDDTSHAGRSRPRKRRRQRGEPEA